LDGCLAEQCWQCIAHAVNSEFDPLQCCNALNRIGKLAILGKDITKPDADRAVYAEEFSQLKTMLSTHRA